MRSNYTDDKPRTINRNMLINLRRHVGQYDKLWSALVMPLVRRTEKWWGSVMGVGSDPELTKWSVHPGSAIVLTGKGYKECHWLVIPPSTTSVISTSTQPSLTLPCRCLLVPSRELKTSSAVAGLQFVSAVRPETAPTLGGPLLPSCSTRRDTV